MFPAAIMMPNWVPPALATSWTRLLFVSAMYTSPAPLSATPPGAFSSAAVAAPPSPDSPLTPAALPATVEIVPEAAATFWTRLLPVSAIYRSRPVTQQRRGRRAAVPRRPRTARRAARNGGNRPRRLGDLLDPVVASVSDVQVPRRVHRHTLRSGQQRQPRRPAIPALPRHPGRRPSDRVHIPGDHRDPPP